MYRKSADVDLYHKVSIHEFRRRSLGAHVELSSHASLGTAVRAARKRATWSQQELADRSGISRVLVARVEGGVGNPTWETVVRLASVLGMRLEVSWEGEPATRALLPRRRQRRPVAVGRVGEKELLAQGNASNGEHIASQGSLPAEPATLRDEIPEPVDLVELVARTRRP
jgi:transcriptional regulator with XRE-family HTH domain